MPAHDGRAAPPPSRAAVAPSPPCPQLLELSPAALAYLAHTFDVYDSSRSGVLSASDIEHMFNRAPVPVYQLDAWNRTLVAGGGAGGAPAAGLTRDGYLTRWKAFALQHDMM
ncbi:hypothetical protein MNEG_15883 [Monoraphidium neglectum]|uniref:EF-hand domain-containing protein n=1 Tax=Monoraphidium neglectum TaxID=145388 RepID=A0A0D2M9M0_9CHLO|nr:hypothetical protein MNEG_15883 [Monoraphidium neglectum]KIY92080.1 hypothetical protein MNEG_15883 [Monoraphidium neglectum]|eukprot:XP_013891100.1 hypothetical protein MNEG_15883 [Monoraphidium neglectum]